MRRTTKPEFKEKRGEVLLNDEGLSYGKTFLETFWSEEYSRSLEEFKKQPIDLNFFSISSDLNKKEFKVKEELMEKLKDLGLSRQEILDLMIDYLNRYNSNLKEAVIRNIEVYMKTSKRKP